MNIARVLRPASVWMALAVLITSLQACELPILCDNDAVSPIILNSSDDVRLASGTTETVFQIRVSEPLLTPAEKITLEGAGSIAAVERPSPNDANEFQILYNVRITGLADGDIATLRIDETTRDRCGNNLAGGYQVNLRVGIPTDLVWDEVFGEDEADLASAVVTDQTGNLYVGGYVTRNETRDMMIAKFTPQGEPLWQLVWGNVGRDEVIDLAVGSTADGQPRLYAAGLFEFSVDVGSSFLIGPGNLNGFLLSMDLDGNVLDQRVFGGDLDDVLTSVDANDAGLVVTSGYATGSFAVQGQSYPGNGLADLFVLVADSNLDNVWNRSFGSDRNDVASTVTFDSADNVWMTGAFQGFITLDASNLISNGLSDVFVARFDSATGAILSATSFGGLTQDVALTITPDANGNTYIGGFYGPSVTFPDGLEWTHGLYANGFVSQWDSSGAMTWSTSLASDRVSEVRDLTWTEAGLVVAAGAYEESLLLDPSLSTTDCDETVCLDSRGGFDGFVLAFADNSGNRDWSYRFGEIYTQDQVNGVTTTLDDQIVAACTFGARVDFGAGSHIADGDSDINVIKMVR